MATLLYEICSNTSKTIVYSVSGAIRKFILRFDLSLSKGRDTRILLLGDDKRWILLMEDKYYEREDNMLNKLQLEKIMAGEMTKEIAELQNIQIREGRRNERLSFYFSCLEKIL